MQARSLLLPASLLFAWSVSVAAGCSSSASDPGAGPGGTNYPTPGHDGGASGDGSVTNPPGTDGGSGFDGATTASCPPSWTTTPECGGGSGGAAPDFGPNVLIFDPSMSKDTIQGKLDDVYGKQDGAQFGPDRYAYFFKPGKYDLDVKIGFYTQALGLGQSPDDVSITGAVRSKADWLGGNNATCNFWRGAENIAVTPVQNIDNNVNRWAVSQGTHLRRMHIKGDIALDDGGWSSGGFVSDSLIDGTIASGSQQQFLTRNNDQNWNGASWNMVFVGDGTAPDPSWPHPAYTITEKTPVIREKPFLYLDGAGNYLVMVPALKSGSQGHSWGSGAPPGSPLAIDRFYLAKPDSDDDASINAALAQGKHLMFTPGVYHLKNALKVSQPGTVVMGLGIATLVADNGNAILSIADVDGVTLAGVLLEAGPQSSTTLLEVGPSGSSANHAANPTVLADVHCRIGGSAAGTAKACVTVNSNNVIGDNLWLWRADHGEGADWNTNKSDNGIIVNGTDVTIYGLFSEHFQQYQTLWNGNGGSVFFYQSEMPYDPPNQGAWMASPGHNGYPSYKVADSVTTHSAQGIGVYSVFSNDVSAENAIEGPTVDGVALHHMVTVSLGSGTIAHIVNGQGDTVGNGNMTSFSDN